MEHIFRAAAYLYDCGVRLAATSRPEIYKLAPQYKQLQQSRDGHVYATSHEWQSVSVRFVGKKINN